MDDFEKIEHLLLNKRFEELSPTELREVSNYFENAADYNDMRDTLSQVKSTLAEDKLLIKPNVELKEKLLQQFDKTYTQAKPGAGGNTVPFYKNIKVQWAAAASVVLIVTIGLVGYFQNLKSNSNDGMAVNYESKKNQPTQQDPAITETNTSEEFVVEEEKSALNDETVTNKKSEDRSEKPIIYGNFSTTESEVGEGSMNNSNIPTTTNGYSTNRDENTIIDTKVEEKNDANYYFNDRLNSEDDIIRSQDKDLKTNTTILPKKDAELKNTSVNYNQSTTKLKKQKGRDKEVKQENIGGMAPQVMAEVSDSTKISIDSLRLDSNMNKNTIEIDQKKDNN